MKSTLTTLCRSIALCAILTSCFDYEDPGPLQGDIKSFAIVDFDEIEIADNFNVEVEESNFFEVTVKGDRRNVNDLLVSKLGNTLIIRYDEPEERHYTTYVKVRMPKLKNAHFSSASVATIEGFESEDALNLSVAGGAVCQFHGGYRIVNISLSGGSTLLMHGLGDDLNALVSGASTLTAFEYPVANASLDVSSASLARITATDNLTVNASGGSTIHYRGSPSIESSLSGGSVLTNQQ
jgi:hypothetical protein